MKNFKKALTNNFVCDIISALFGGLAQLGEHLPYKQRVTGSSPVPPTSKASRKACLFLLLKKGSNLVKARSVKKNSLLRLFFSEVVRDGNRYSGRRAIKTPTAALPCTSTSREPRHAIRVPRFFFVLCNHTRKATKHPKQQGVLCVFN